MAFSYPRLRPFSCALRGGWLRLVGRLVRRLACRLVLALSLCVSSCRLVSSRRLAWRLAVIVSSGVSCSSFLSSCSDWRCLLVMVSRRDAVRIVICLIHVVSLGEALSCRRAKRCVIFAAAVCSARLVCGGGGPSWRTVWGVLCYAVLVGVLRCSSLFFVYPVSLSVVAAGGAGYAV